MNNLIKKTLGSFLLLTLGGNGILTQAQSSTKTQASKRSHSQRSKKKIVIGTGGSITKEWAKRRPELLKKIQDDLLRGEGNDHDDPIHLGEVGDISSVPSMIAVLKRNPVYPDGTMICTRAHCLYGLIKLTGVNVGNTDGAWEKWWEDYKKSH